MVVLHNQPILELMFAIAGRGPTVEIKHDGTCHGLPVSLGLEFCCLIWMGEDHHSGDDY